MFWHAVPYSIKPIFTSVKIVFTDTIVCMYGVCTIGVRAFCLHYTPIYLLSTVTIGCQILCLFPLGVIIYCYLLHDLVILT
jgi:hypothetical protein